MAARTGSPIQVLNILIVYKKRQNVLRGICLINLTSVDPQKVGRNHKWKAAFRLTLRCFYQFRQGVIFDTNHTDINCFRLISTYMFWHEFFGEVKSTNEHFLSECNHVRR